MKYFRNLLMAVVCVVGFSGVSTAADTFKIDKAHTSIVFMIKHLGYSNMFGRFNEFDGNIMFDQSNISASKVNLVIKASSVDTAHDARDKHLRSPDFLNTAEFPEITFKSTSARKTGDKTGKITGDLTILGKTKSVTLDVTFNRVAKHPIPSYKGVIVAGFSARAKVNRLDYGMTYAKGGIGSTLDLFLEVESVKQ
jgi:polyisoprenoid-binding protein YceI